MRIYAKFDSVVSIKIVSFEAYFEPFCHDDDELERVVVSYKQSGFRH
jgi:hypothetical protein